MNQQKPLIIVGASGFGLEVLLLAQRAGVPVKGFLDDAFTAGGTTVVGLPLLGKVEEWIHHADGQFVVAVGNPRIRQKLVTRMVALGQVPFATLVDPAAVAEPAHVTLGAGSIVCAGAVLTTQITLGQHAIVNINATIGHETILGDFVTVAPLAAISGRVVLHDLVEVGTGAAIRQGVTMGTGSMLGMGGVLTKDADPHAILVGNPAKVLRYQPETA